jgi:transcriptional regulator GlxA family with amidase domain
MPREGKHKNIAIVTYPGVALLDLVVTQTVLDRGTKYRTVTVGERTDPTRSDTPMAIVPEKRFEEVPDPFAIIVPGGGIASLEAMGNERLLNYLRFAEHGAELVISVSTGAFVLAAAGLLEGRRATTHPAYAELLEKLGVDYVRSYSVEDGKFVTTEGVSAGIDTMLELVARLRSEAAARRAGHNRVRSTAAFRGRRLERGERGRACADVGRAPRGPGAGARGQAGSLPEVVRLNHVTARRRHHAASRKGGERPA